MSLAEIESPQVGGRSALLPPAPSDDSGIVVPYAISDSVENPVMVAGFGYGFNVIEATGILWYLEIPALSTGRIRRS